jgi:hypothetical protein
MKEQLFFILLVKLPNGKVIKTNKMDILTTDIEMLKLQVSFISNIPYNSFELLWEKQILSPDRLLLKDIDINGSKLPINQANVNNLIFLIMN